ncbi:MAG TPA: AEC family transporter [Clostridia bacterium]|nr:AEC family transporter [Clostridia bacterium]
MGNVNTIFAVSTCIILLGYIIKKFNIITEKDGEALTKVILNVTLPALVINSTSTLKFDLSLGLMPLFAITYGLMISSFAIFFFRKQDKIDRGMLSMLMPGFSVGLFAYPFVEAIFGSRALNYAAMFDIGNSLIVFIIAYSIGGYFSSEDFSLDPKSILKQLSRSIPLIVYIITLIISIAGLHYPTPLMSIAQTVSKANMPLSFLVMGIFLSFKIEKRHWFNMFKVLGARYFIGITISLLLYFILPFNELFRKIILICLILPPPITMMAFTVKFKFNAQFVGMLINMANVISYILMWVIFNIIT